MDKKRLILLIILLLAIVLIVLGVKGNVFKENRQNMELRSSGDDNSHWFHLSGVVVEKTFDTLLIELNEKEESSLFFDTTKVSLDCTKCKGDLEQVSEGNVIKFYFFKYNIDGETVKIEYDESLRSLNQILDDYYKIIDPTSLNKQGEDEGISYRTGIYYTNESDLEIIQNKTNEIQKKYQEKVVVEIQPLDNFYEAEEYHQKYLEKNPQGYCHIGKCFFG